MNCLLLLFILLCCGGNGCSGNGSVGNGCSRNGSVGNGCSRNGSVGNGCGGNGCGSSHRHNCDNFTTCDTTSGRGNGNARETCEALNNSCHTPPPMPRTQFPYLDVEPRTCGCEEKSNS